ncbi:hypothetical protein [Roseospira navarrensis]|uniref:CsbD family protein n=1 Tax=Roseospira navarrensis TaxID=140058 RepID=A0A7X1ZGZ9_9PROT|nr:hypothetical protein [Roseospira navarrensis]MQX38369.1 hypothetical protein [Roseospira navarrensis]
MNTRHLCETHWDWTRDQVLSTWSSLSDREVDSVAGDYDGLVSLLSDRYGYGWSEAADRLDEMAAGS